MNAKQRERDAAVRELREILKPGDTVYTQIKHVSRSGMSRVIMPVIIQDNKPQYIGWLVANACGDTYDRKHEGIKIVGCGMDMGFHLVYQLSRVLFPDGFGILGRYPNGSEGRPASKEMAAAAVESGAEFYGRNGDRSGWDNDGGYALKQRWL